MDSNKISVINQQVALQLIMKSVVLVVFSSEFWLLCLLKVVLSALSTKKDDGDSSHVLRARLYLPAIYEADI